MFGTAMPTSLLVPFAFKSGMRQLCDLSFGKVFLFFK
jgi:hypothetical protein